MSIIIFPHLCCCCKCWRSAVVVANAVVVWFFPVVANPGVASAVAVADAVVA